MRRSAFATRIVGAYEDADAARPVVDGGALEIDLL
jgi:hypothetical protein